MVDLDNAVSKHESFLTDAVKVRDLRWEPGDRLTLKLDKPVLDSHRFNLAKGLPYNWRHIRASEVHLERD